MRPFRKQLLAAGGPALFLAAVFPAIADEPKPLMLTGTEVYRDRAMQEIRKQKPEIDAAKLSCVGVSCSYTPEQPNSHWYESVQVTFADPTMDKIVSRGSFKVATGAQVAVQFIREPRHAVEPLVQVQTATSSRVLNQSADPFGDGPATSPTPSPSAKPAATP